MGAATAIATTVGVGYAFGQLPVAATVARRHGIADLCEVGDRNPGYWNAKELLGARAALPIFVGDAAKGAAAAGVGLALCRGNPWAAYAGGAAAMIGHAWPIMGGLRGGRSVLTFVGTGLVAAPRPAAVAITATATTWAMTSRFDHAARLGIAAFPIIQLALEGPRRTAATGALMSLIGWRFAQAARADRRRHDRRRDDLRRDDHDRATRPRHDDDRNGSRSASATIASGSASGDNQ